MKAILDALPPERDNLLHQANRFEALQVDLAEAAGQYERNMVHDMPYEVRELMRREALYLRMASDLMRQASESARDVHRFACDVLDKLVPR